MTIVFLVILSCISAILYRLGGASKADQLKEFPWLKGFKPWKARDVWCSICVIVGMLAVGINAPFWAWALSFGLMWGATSTYWDEVFGYDNHYAHGLGIGLACIPVAFFSEPLALGVRAALLAILMGVWSQAVGEAKSEEMGRGFVLPLTLIIVILI